MLKSKLINAIEWALSLKICNMIIIKTLTASLFEGLLFSDFNEKFLLKGRVFMKIYADLRRTLSSFDFRFKQLTPTFDFQDREKIVGTTIEALDENGELLKVKLKQMPSDFESIADLKVFDEIKFLGLDATVYARTSKGSDYAEPRLSFTAEDVKKAGV
ncbi:TPA: hypothetical protein TXY98_000963 [Streptococcus suis]|nr:hypothetical protein [Streptococcus suis]